MKTISDLYSVLSTNPMSLLNAYGSSTPALSFYSIAFGSGIECQGNYNPIIAKFMVDAGMETKINDNGYIYGTSFIALSEEKTISITITLT